MWSLTFKRQNFKARTPHTARPLAWPTVWRRDTTNITAIMLNTQLQAIERTKTHAHKKHDTLALSLSLSLSHTHIIHRSNAPFPRVWLTLSRVADSQIYSGQFTDATRGSVAHDKLNTGARGAVSSTHSPLLIVRLASGREQYPSPVTPPAPLLSLLCL